MSSIVQQLQGLRTTGVDVAVVHSNFVLDQGNMVLSELLRIEHRIIHCVQTFSDGHSCVVVSEETVFNLLEGNHQITQDLHRLVVGVSFEVFHVFVEYKFKLLFVFLIGFVCAQHLDTIRILGAV